jgi:chromosome segregation ATPase
MSYGESLKTVWPMIDDYASELSDKQDRIDELESTLETKIERKRYYKGEVEALNETVHELRVELGEWKGADICNDAEIEDLIKNHDEQINEHQDNFEDLKRERDKVQENLDEISSQLDEALEEVDVVEKKLKIMTSVVLRIPPNPISLKRRRSASW